jgi:MutS-like protein
MILSMNLRKNYHSSVLFVTLFGMLSAETLPTRSQDDLSCRISYQTIQELFSDSLVRPTKNKNDNPGDDSLDKFSERDCLAAAFQNFNELDKKSFDESKNRTEDPANLSLRSLLVKTLEDAHLLRGPESDKYRNSALLLGKDFTMGHFATVRFAHILANTVCDAELKKRQDAIRGLLEGRLYDEMQLNLRKLSNLQNSVVVYSKQCPTSLKKILDELSLVGTVGHYAPTAGVLILDCLLIYLLGSFVKKFSNTDENIVDKKNIAEKMNGVEVALDKDIVHFKGLENTNKCTIINNDVLDNILVYVDLYRQSCMPSGKGFTELLNERKNSSNNSLYSRLGNRNMGLAMGANLTVTLLVERLLPMAYGGDSFLNYKSFAKQHRAFMSLRRTIKEYVTLCEAACHVNRLLQKHLHIKQNLKSTKGIEGLASAHGGSDEFGYLVSLLQANTFKDDDSWWCNVSNIVNAHNLLKKPEHHQRFMRAMEELAELDVYAGIARNIDESKKGEPSLCFVDFDEKAGLELTNVWHMGLSGKKAVPNDVHLGGNNQSVAILTGPNTGGKSTWLTSTIAAAWLAMHIGVAPAEKAKMTPVDVSILSTNPKDDVAKNASLFQAEVTRAADILDLLKQHPEKKFILIFDELFKGTREKEASLLALEYLKELVKTCPGCLIVFSTHFEAVCELEKQYPEVFKNYYIEAYVDKNGNIIRTFKLKPGINHINLVANMAASQLGVTLHKG